MRWRANHTATWTAGLVLLMAAASHAQQVLMTDEGLAREELGQSMTAAGDVDGDGYPDFACGGYRRLRVYSGLRGTVIYDLTITALALAGGRDLDGDQVPDLVAGNYLDDTNGMDSGMVTVISGRTGTTLRRIYGDSATEEFGAAVDVIADLNQDGYDDVIVGARRDDAFGVDGGSVHAYSGATGLPFYSTFGLPGESLGHSIAATGDLDGDQIADFVSGAPDSDQGGLVDNGRVLAFSGATGAPLWTRDGRSTDNRLGWSLACIGDIDGDGVDEIAAGAPWADDNGAESGMVRILSGANGLIRDTWSGDTAGDHFGWDVSGIGDVNWDLVPDVLVGAPGYDSGFNIDAGLAQTMSGVNGATFYAYERGQPGTGFGETVAAAGDLDLNGFSEILVGEPNSGYAAPSSGRITAVSTDPAFWYNYGSGWPGRLGIPSLTCTDDPSLGNNIRIQLGNSRGSTTPALLFAGFVETQVPSQTGTIWVQPSFTFLLSVPTSGLMIPWGVPSDPSTAGLNLFLQALEVDPLAVGGISFTHGLFVGVGYDYP